MFERALRERQRPSIALYGLTGSGKTAVAKRFVEGFGYQRCSSGEICRQISQILFQSEDKTNLNRLSDALLGIDKLLFLKAALSRAIPGKAVVFDSMRCVEEYDYLRNLGFRMVKVTCPVDSRTLHLAARGQVFVTGLDDLHLTETCLEGHDFHATIDNAKDVDYLYSCVDATMAALLDSAGNLSGIDSKWLSRLR
jgi:hypothetical protein